MSTDISLLSAKWYVHLTALHCSGTSDATASARLFTSSVDAVVQCAQLLYHLRNLHDLDSFPRYLALRVSLLDVFRMDYANIHSVPHFYTSSLFERRKGKRLTISAV